MVTENDCKNIIQLIPDARLLLSSLRSVGYTLNAAISDILDNSISAKATKIEIDFIWDYMKPIQRVATLRNICDRLRKALK